MSRLFYQQEKILPDRTEVEWPAADQEGAATGVPPAAAHPDPHNQSPAPPPPPKEPARPDYSAASTEQ